MDTQTVSIIMSDLLRMEEGTRQSYDAALGKLGTSKVAPSMQRIREVHRLHRDGLEAILRQMGQEREDSDAAGFYATTITDSVAKAREYDGVLTTLRVAEAALELQYDEALRVGLPDDVAKQVRKFASAEREHVNLLELVEAGLPQV